MKKVDQEILEIEPTSYALYRYEVLNQPYISKWPKEEVDALLDQARQGDQDARELLIKCCLAFVFYRAWRYTDQLRHDDPMDLVSIGNIALLEGLDKALTEAVHPIKYLLSHAAFAMQHYVYHDSYLIKRDKHRNEVIQTVSLDQALGASDLTYADLVGALQEFDMLSESETNSDVFYGPLYEAINQLTEKQRFVVVKHFGLENAPETFAEISRRLSLRPESAWKNWKLAQKRLQKLLGAC